MFVVLGRDQVAQRSFGHEQVQKCLAIWDFCMNLVHPGSWLPARCMLPAALGWDQDLMYCHNCFINRPLHGSPALLAWFCCLVDTNLQEVAITSVDTYVKTRVLEPHIRISCTVLASQPIFSQRYGSLNAQHTLVLISLQIVSVRLSELQHETHAFGEHGHKLYQTPRSREAE